MGVVVAIVAVVVILLVTSGGSSAKPNAHQAAMNWSFNGSKVYGGIGPEGVPLELGTPMASPNAGLTGSVIDGVQCNAGEKLTYHHHIHLMIFINGKPSPLPLGVGMVPPALVSKTPQGDFAQGSQTCLYWLHVHAQDGIVHIESPDVRTFVLGQVFGIWHQTLSATQIGSTTGHVTATVNGQPWQGDPSDIPLNEHDQIVLNLGGPVANPPQIDWSGTGL